MLIAPTSLLRFMMDASLQLTCLVIHSLDIYYQDYLDNGFGNPHYVQTLNHPLVVASNLRINRNQDYIKDGFFQVNQSR